jgi:hypothetical protein
LLAPVMKVIVVMSPACPVARPTARDASTVGGPVPAKPASDGG